MYKAGTVEEILVLKDKIPDEVYFKAFNIATMLDSQFGDDRDVENDDGGFVFVAESEDDLDYFIKNCVELESPLREYVEIIESEKGPYLNVFFLYNEYEYGITLFVPVSVAPESLLKDLLLPDRGEGAGNSKKVINWF